MKRLSECYVVIIGDAGYVSKALKIANICRLRLKARITYYRATLSDDYSNRIRTLTIMLERDW